MKTKQRILQQAITCYNAKGLMNITSRDLASELGMSHGNLEYHFPNKDVLIKAIYKQMRKEISVVYESSTEDLDPFVHFDKLLLELEQFHKKYSFFNLDVLEISRNYPSVNKLLKRTFQVRNSQMLHFYERFIDCGYFKKEPIPGMYMRLQHTIRIIITFWNSQKMVIPNFSKAEKGNMRSYIWELLIPHMTQLGLEAYKKRYK